MGVQLHLPETRMGTGRRAEWMGRLGTQTDVGEVEVAQDERGGGGGGGLGGG